MNYELAIKLKEAGFPQEPFWSDYGEMIYYGGSWYFIPVEEGCPNIVFADEKLYEEGIKRGDNLIKIPILSELIEACGGVFIDLRREKENEWVAKSQELINEKDNKVLLVSGTIPEEAIARLWLELNKNKTTKKI